MTLTAGPLAYPDMSATLRQATRIIRMLLQNPNDLNARGLALDFLEIIQQQDDNPVPPPKAQWTDGGPSKAPASPAIASEPLDGPIAPPKAPDPLKRGNAPFGWKWMKAPGGGRKEMVQDDREQRVLALLAQLRNSGFSYRQMVADLNARGSDYAPREGPVWTMPSLRLRLRQVIDAERRAIEEAESKSRSAFASTPSKTRNDVNADQPPA